MSLLRGIIVTIIPFSRRRTMTTGLTWPSTAQKKMKIYAHRLSFYTIIDEEEVSEIINGFIDLYAHAIVSKNTLRKLVKNYLRRLSFYTDIYTDSVYKYIDLNIITPILIPL
jgi:hypothetical protein